MKHYDYIEWILYKEKVFSDEKLNEMEEHLYICDECMDIFLALIDKREEKIAEKIVPIDFTNKVMENIPKTQFKLKTKIEKQNTKIKEMFIYYVAVASVAIVLTLGGFYSGMVDMVPNVTSSIAKKYEVDPPKFVFNLSQRIVNKTSNFINNFEISSIEEELK